MGQEKALPWKNWEVVKLIGKGTYGDVYEIRKENTQYAARAALKVIHVTGIVFTGNAGEYYFRD